MKNLLSIIFLLAIVGNSYGQEGSIFSFAGKVFLGSDNGESVTISLYDNNKKISSYQTSKNGKFVIDAERNKHYTIQFNKEGFITKRLIIDTYVDEQYATGIKTFKFDVELIKKEEGKNYAILDFPIAIIEFLYISKEFSYNQKYTEAMLEVQDDILTSKSNIASN